MRPLLLTLLCLSLALAGCSKAPPPASSTTTTSTTPATGGTTPTTNGTSGNATGSTGATTMAPKDLCSDTKDFSMQQPDPATPGSFVATTKSCPGVTAGYTTITMTVDWSGSTPAPAVAQNGVTVKLVDPNKGTVGSCGGPSPGPMPGGAKCMVGGSAVVGDYTLRYEGGGTLVAKVKVAVS